MAVRLHPEGSGWKLCHLTSDFFPKLGDVGASLNSAHSETAAKTNDKNISPSSRSRDLKLILNLKYAYLSSGILNS